MNHYIIENKIITYDNELDSTLYSYEKLTQEQAEFYELHNCSLEEVKNLKLNEVHILSLEEILSSLKSKILNDLELKFIQRLKQGYFDETLDITLCFEDVDRTQLSQLLVQLDNLEKLNICPPTITFSDFSGGFQTVSILEYRGLIARYGMKYVEVWGTKKYYEGLVNSSDEQNLEAMRIQIENLEL